MVNHWMNCHGMSTAPPEFKFRLVNVHKEALSRQLDEAVHIRSIGNLNKKNEFAINELIRLESCKYSWDAEAEVKRSIKSEKEEGEKLQNFIQVMRNVYRCAITMSQG